jgi:hypothetical protein
MFRLIKWLIIIAIIAGVAMWVTDYKLKGKTIGEWVAPVTESKMVKTGIRDVRSIVGEGLKAAGEAISEDITDDERGELEGLLKKEISKGSSPIEGAENQEALPPQKRDDANTMPKNNLE